MFSQKIIFIQNSPEHIIFSRVIYLKIIRLLEKKLNDMEIKITVLKIKDKT